MLQVSPIGIINMSESLSQAKLEYLFTKYYPTLCQVSYSIVKNMDAAKDIVQDFFIKYWEKYKDLQQPASFEAYAYVSVKNRSFNYIESQEVKQRHTEQVKNSLYGEEKGINTETDHQENYRIQLIKAIDQLPAQRRKVFMLSAVDRMKYIDIAQQMNISINTVKTQIRKAYISIRKSCNILTILIIIVCFNFGVTLFPYLAVFNNVK